MRNSVLDGSVQRQMLLVKLVHEMESRPDFGVGCNYDPDSNIQLWLARVGALMERVGVSQGLKFRSSISNCCSILGTLDEDCTNRGQGSDRDFETRI